MSVQAIAWVLDHSPTTGRHRLVLIALANHAGRSPTDGAFEAWPGVATIAAEANIARERTVQETLAELEAAGAIERIRNGAPDTRVRADRRPNLYRIRLDHGVPPSVTPSNGAETVDNCANSRERGDDFDPHGVAVLAPRGDTRVTPESLEPKTNLSSSRAEVHPPPPATVDDESKIAEALALIVAASLAEREAKLGAVADPTRWTRAALTRARADYAARAADLLARRPSLDARGLASTLLAGTGRGPDPAEATVAAMLALAEENDRRMADEALIPFPEPDTWRAGLGQLRSSLG